MSSSLALRLADASSLDKKKFTAKYPHPWLIAEFVKLPEPTPQRFEPRPLITDSMAQGARRMIATKPSALALKTRTESFVLLPIAKSDRNPWEERILVGRVSNNDIVLQDSSVSKAHAYFVNQGSRCLLVALPTVNPTKMNGTALIPNSDGVPIADGATLEFGLVGCRYLECASLYALLTARS